MQDYDRIFELYYKEHERKETINSKATIMVAIITVLFAGCGSLFEQLADFEKFTFLWYMTIVLMCVAVIATGNTVRLFCKTYTGYEYGYIPFDGLQVYKSELERYYESEEKKEELVEAEIRKAIRDYLEEAILLNFQNNVAKNAKLLKLYYATLIACVIVPVVWGVITVLNIYCAGSGGEILWQITIQR